MRGYIIIYVQSDEADEIVHQHVVAEWEEIVYQHVDAESEPAVTCLLMGVESRTETCEEGW